MRLLFLASAALCLCEASINIRIFREDAAQSGDIDVAQSDDNEVTQNDDNEVTQNDDNEVTQLADNHVDKLSEDDANQQVRDKQLTNRFVNGLQGAFPPVIEESLSAKTCSCNQLLLSSLGPTQQHLAAVLGVYKKYGEYNSKPVYFGPNSKRLYFLPSGWLVGDSPGAPTGYIHNGNKSRSLCAYEIPSGWLFFSGQSGQWYQDNTLVLRCIQ